MYMHKLKIVRYYTSHEHPYSPLLPTFKDNDFKKRWRPFSSYLSFIDKSMFTRDLFDSAATSLHCPCVWEPKSTSIHIKSEEK